VPPVRDERRLVARGAIRFTRPTTGSISSVKCVEPCRSAASRSNAATPHPYGRRTTSAGSSAAPSSGKHHSPPHTPTAGRFCKRTSSKDRKSLRLRATQRARSTVFRVGSSGVPGHDRSCPRLRAACRIGALATTPCSPFRRRQFLSATSALFAWAAIARAQQAGKIHRLGIPSVGRPVPGA
jgi:hypothetical protein